MGSSERENHSRSQAMIPGLDNYVKIFINGYRSILCAQGSFERDRFFCGQALCKHRRAKDLTRLRAMLNLREVGGQAKRTQTNAWHHAFPRHRIGSMPLLGILKEAVLRDDFLGGVTQL